MTERKWRIRPIPCGVYDIEGTEIWLEEQEAQGWQLYGIWACFARFDACPPRAVRYRLEAGSRRMGMEEAVDRRTADFYAQQGWHYAAVRGPLAIYRCEDPQAPELDTDPQLQAVTLGRVERRERLSLVLLVLCMFLLFLRWRNGSWILAAISEGTPLFLLEIALYLWFLSVTLLWVLRLHRIRKNLAAGEPLRHRSDWRRRAARRFAACALAAVLVITYYLGLALRLDWLEEQETVLPGDLAALPFATLTDLAGGDRWEADNGYPGGCGLVSLSDALVPVVMEFDQTGTVYCGETVLFSGSLHVNYYETAAPFLAQSLLTARHASARRTWESQGAYAPLSLPDLGVEVDAAAAYEALLPTLLLADGSRMVQISLQSFEEELPFGQWARAAAAAFVSAGD